jgi:hypothetical protein
MNSIYKFPQWLIALFFIYQTFVMADPYSIVFVHLGPKIPPHVEVALSQARLFNPDCPIYLLANNEALKAFHPQDPNIRGTYIPLEELEKTPTHNIWKENSTLRNWDPYNKRFLYLYDFIEKFQLENVFHMEHDNMLYADLQTLLPIFLERYSGLGITFDNDQRCICGFMYIRNSSIMGDFARYLADHAHMNWSDMYAPAYFKNSRKSEDVTHLPIVISEYVKDHKLLESYYGNKASKKSLFCLNFEAFQSVFDAAALGQFLGGTHQAFPAGFINEACIFTPLDFSYEWRLDEQNRRVPYIIYKGNAYRINNLHIHSKNLAAFSSRLSGMYTLGYLTPSYHKK